MNPRTWIVIGSLAAALSVVTGAFAAHGLEKQLSNAGVSTGEIPRLLEVFDTAARYQMYHALAIVAVGLIGLWGRGKSLQAAGWAFLVGIVLFSGSLYALVFTQIKWLGAITPLGGLAFIVGWLLLAIAAAKLPSPSSP
jgi:uncharacterized membrane protein YgdD (TMEM256/DUF423 family)